MNVSRVDETFYHVEYRVRRWMTQEAPVRVFGSAWYPEAEVRFTDVHDVQPYVDKVLAHIGCPRPITVRERKGSAFAHYEPLGAVMAVPPRRNGGEWALREIVILHEITHHLVPGAGHGGAFARRFVDLLTETGHPVLGRMLEIACFEGRQPIAPA